MKGTVLKSLFLVIVVMLLQSCSVTPENWKEENRYKKYRSIDAPLGFDYQKFYKGELKFRSYDNTAKNLSQLRDNIAVLAKVKDWEQLAFNLYLYRYTQDYYYYLYGLTAENLNHPEGALEYYKMALKAFEDGYSCKNGFVACYGFSFPEDIHSAINRTQKIVDHLYRTRDVEISVKQDGSLIMIGDSMFKSPHTFKLIPGEYKVIISTNTAVEEKILNLSADVKGLSKVQFEINENPELSISVNYFKKVGEIAKLQKNRLNKSSDLYSFDELPSLIKSINSIKNQIKATKKILFIVRDIKSSLHSSIKEYINIENQLLELYKSKVQLIKTQDIFEHIKLSEALSENGIEAKHVDLFIMGKSLNDSEFLNARIPDRLGVCDSYILVTKGGNIDTNIVDSKSTQYSSNYIGEYRDEPNPRYSQLKSKLRQAKYEMESSKIENSNTSAPGLGYGGAFLMGMAKAILEDKHQESIDKIQARLSKTSRVIQKEIEVEYYLTKKNIIFSKNHQYDWLSINCNSGKVSTYKVSNKENKSFILYEGIRSDDLNNLQDSNQDVKGHMKDWSKAPLVSLLDIQGSNNKLIFTDVIKVSAKSIVGRVNKFLLTDK